MAPSSGESQIPHHRPVVSTVPAGCLVIFGGLVLVLAVAVIAYSALLAPGYRDTVTYREAMRLVRTSPEARAALGEPIEEAGLVSFITENGDAAALRFDGTFARRLSLRVSGPRAHATLFAQGEERYGQGTLGAVVLTLGDGRTIALHKAP